MDLEKNMQAQRIYPTEVYKGYEEINQYRKKHGMWWSTGEGAKSFEGHIYQADDQKDCSRWVFAITTICDMLTLV